ncbi:hypothetical protein M0K80_RS09710 [Providencia rettgeri]|nr:hypothetical protein [Providencia rettgeri]
MSTMIQPTKNRHGVYTLRMAVPAELKDTLGKGELKRSLKTKDLAEPKRKAPAITALMRCSGVCCSEDWVITEPLQRVLRVPPN